MASNTVQTIFVYIVFSLTTVVSLICLCLLYSRRDKQPIKSRAPLWLGISLIMGQIQSGSNLWGIVGKTECHYARIIYFLSYSGYAMSLIVRCWKLHFVFNINKTKLLKTDYKTWFHRSKFYVSDRFLIPVFFGCCLCLCLIGFLFVATDPENTWHTKFGSECRALWLPEIVTNAAIFGACVIVLIVFVFLLRDTEDGFSICLELRFSVVLLLSSWIIYFCLHYLLKNLPFTPGWFIIFAQIGSTAAAVHWPLYLSFTDKWNDCQCPTVHRVSLNDLKNMYYFLNTIDGIEPFLRFLHSEFSAELLFLWRDIEEFSKEVDPEDRKFKARTILEEYLDPEGNKFMPDSEIFQSNLKQHMAAAEISANMFNEVKEEVEKRLRSRFMRFLQSSTYKQYATGVTIKESLMELGWQH